MNKDRAASIAAIAVRGEQIKQNSAEYLWVCCGVRPPLLPDRPVVADPSVNPEHLQVQLCRRGGSTRR